MRAIQIVELSGPESALKLVDIPEPGGEGVVIDVRAAGVSFPEVLQTRGAYQVKPELPFVPGSEVAGIVKQPGHGFDAGDRVAAFPMLGGFAEVAVAPAHFTFKLPDALDFAQGAGLILNYHTAYFSLVNRGRLRSGETVLVHGAAGGVGTAAIQVAKGLGATAYAVVSTDEKEQTAREAGADEAVLLDGFKGAVQELTGGRGVDVVLDVVGGDAFTDSLRSLAPQGRLLVVGFASGQGIPEVKVNRLLLNNVDVRGVGWGAYAMVRPGFMQEQWAELLPMLESGVVKPPIGATYAFEEFGRALADMDERRTLGKSVVRVRD